MNSLRAYRISELTAAIHETERDLVAHTAAHPGAAATPEQQDAWSARDLALRAELHQRRAERLREIEKPEGVPC